MELAIIEEDMRVIRSLEKAGKLFVVEPNKKLLEEATSASTMLSSASSFFSSTRTEKPASPSESQTDKGSEKKEKKPTKTPTYYGHG